MPKFDIIIPAYNAARYLPISIPSVIAQTYDDWRILLIDDGSTDNTAEIVAPYIDQLGPRIKYIYQPNKGLPAARNTAIRNSSAEYLAILDADDIWLPNRLLETLRHLEKHPEAGLSYSFVELINQAGETIQVCNIANKHAEGHLAPYLYMRSVDLPCPTITFRRECVDKVGLFDETLRATEDRDMWLRIAQQYQVTLVPHVLAQYRMAPGSMSADPERMLKAQLQFINKHYGESGCGWLQRQVAMSRSYNQRAMALRNRGEKTAALMSSIHALGLYPLDPGNVRTTASLLLNALTPSR